MGGGIRVSKHDFNKVCQYGVNLPSIAIHQKRIFHGLTPQNLNYIILSENPAYFPEEKKEVKLIDQNKKIKKKTKIIKHKKRKLKN